MTANAAVQDIVVKYAKASFLTLTLSNNPARLRAHFREGDQIKAAPMKALVDRIPGAAAMIEGADLIVTEGLPDVFKAWAEAGYLMSPINQIALCRIEAVLNGERPDAKTIRLVMQ